MPICPTCARAVPDGLEHCPSDGTKLTAAPAWIGRVLGDRYRLQATIGEGGMGTVYLAEHVVLGKPLAVKVLREEYSRDEDLVRRFQQEAIAASQIGQENIVNIIDFGRTPEGALYFVMEHLSGRSLLKTIQHFGPLRPSRALPILVQICRALAAAHSRGIVHRDLKPENVMLVPREDGSDLVKVLDFGISQVGSAREGERITRVGVVLGTPEYMAPEQVEGQKMDQRVDIYALGILAYEVLTGTVPFHGSSPMAILVKQQSEAPQPPTARKPGLALPPGLEPLLLSMLEKDPAKRPQTMLEVATALTGIDGGVAPTPRPAPRPGPSLASSLPPSVPPVAAPSKSVTTHLGTQELAAIRQRSPAPWIVALATLVILGAGGVVMWRSPGPELPPETAAPAEPAPSPLPAVPEELRVALSSVPAGATVWRGETRVGVTPLEVELAPGERAEYHFTLAGHLPAKKVVSADATRVEVRLSRKPRRSNRRDVADGFQKIDDLKENPFQ